MTWKIPLFDVYWDESDVSSVSNIIRSGRGWSGGAVMEEFENLISFYVDAKEAISFNSGTSALYSSLKCFDIGIGDEVIVPSYSFIATANVVKLVGATPVFCDIESERYGLNPDKIPELISKNTKAIIPVHYGGMPCRINEIAEIAADYKLILLEDAAESLGSRYGNTMIGTIGDVGMYSFTDPKCISTGEGGIIVTNSSEHAQKLRLFRSHGRSIKNYFEMSQSVDYTTLGHNFRMPSIISALGISQLNKIESLINKRIEISKKYDNTLQKFSSIVQPMKRVTNCRNVYQVYPVFTSFRNSLMEYLSREGIMTKIYFEPIHKSYYYKNVLKYDVTLPVTEAVSRSVLVIPCNPTLSDSNILSIITALNTFFSNV